MIIDRGRVTAALPGYTLGAELGSGAFGLVLAGEHRWMGRSVAVKVMKADGPEGLTVDFASEARILAGLDHPHVVRAYDYLEVDGLCLVVMELLAGGTLTRRRRGMSPQQACAVGLSVAAALEHAHSRGVLHRDIKADNILFTAEGTVKVTDFGIARMFEGSAATASGMAGTPMYMAPEQIEGGRIGPATDLYALGVVLYQLLTGAPPFNPRQPVQGLWRQHLTEPPPPLYGVPTAIAQVVLRALAKNPADRHPDARTFAVDLATAATSGYGPSWSEHTGLLLHLDDTIRRAATSPPIPASPRNAKGSSWDLRAVFRWVATPSGGNPLAPQGRADELRARVDAGDMFAALQQARRLARQGQIDELYACAEAGDRFALRELTRLLVRKKRVQEAILLLRPHVDAGDMFAVRGLADLLTQKGRIKEAILLLRPHADAGEMLAALELARLLARRKQVKELRTRAAAGDRFALRELTHLLLRRRRVQEATFLLDTHIAPVAGARPVR